MTLVHAEVVKNIKNVADNKKTQQLNNKNITTTHYISSLIITSNKQHCTAKTSYNSIN